MKSETLQAAIRISLTKVPRRKKTAKSMIQRKTMIQKKTMIQR